MTSLFHNFIFYVHLQPYQSIKITRIIESLNGHCHHSFQYDKTTHVISNTLEELPRDIQKLNSIHKVVVVKLSKESQLNVQAWVELHGGKFRVSFDQRYTHLLTDDISRFKKQDYSLPSRLIVVSTEWFNQCVLNECWVNEKPFIQALPATSPKLFSPFTFFIPNDNYPSDLIVKEAITERIKQYGGNTATTIEQSNIVILQYQTDPTYELTIKMNLKSATTDWINDCIVQGCIIKLSESVLYRPIRSKDSVIGSECKYRISITKYDGMERDHIKGMIGIIGATYTSDLSSENTHLNQ
ncbi:hypothetical protein PPL_07428 [Heterostelium album PN500]|uniref:BRCT domain-containing protein n=1 Tax=Heterostelium pallidum (strain ATCC 26659 / Pp 5 / PN500) TaxID=670386 RepID=D3BFX7_HETP5|nr:hypothetical protein PPL_07428 [Heterostelium album PN500]EFA79737.1 hypothetical protein PPL_07428 [Heterostelium album PN500]|eukprot:XP_020431858.1 hypothetical protein PPL_07428 [Heterostelium album PN500]